MEFLSPIEVQKDPLHNVLEEVEIWSRSWFLMADKGDDENLRSFENNHKSFLICVCQVDMYVSVIGLHFMREYPNYWEL